MEQIMSPWVTILKLGTQDTLRTILTSWHFCQLTNHVIKTMVAMTLDPQVNPNININICEPQTNHQRIFNFEVAT